MKTILSLTVIAVGFFSSPVMAFLDVDGRGSNSGGFFVHGFGFGGDTSSFELAEGGAIQVERRQIQRDNQSPVHLETLRQEVALHVQKNFPAYNFKLLVVKAESRQLDAAIRGRDIEREVVAQLVRILIQEQKPLTSVEVRTLERRRSIFGGWYGLVDDSGANLSFFKVREQKNLIPVLIGRPLDGNRGLLSGKALVDKILNRYTISGIKCESLSKHDLITDNLGENRFQFETKILCQAFIPSVILTPIQ